MTTAFILQALHSALPDERVQKDVRAALEEDSTNGHAAIELDGHWVDVPIDAFLEVVTKAFFDERFDVGFGVYRAEVAIGGVVDLRHGFIKAKICFSTLYYNVETKLITLDFHKEFR